MKKLVLVIVCLFSISLYSQSFGVGASLNVPVDSEFKEVSSTGYVLGASFFLPVGNVEGVIYGGYGLWNKETLESDSVSSEIDYKNLPVVMVGARKYFGKFYGSLLAGIYPVEAEVTVLDVEGEELSKESLSETQGALYPVVGYVFPLSSFGVDLSAGYLWTQDYSQLSFQLAVLF